MKLFVGTVMILVPLACGSCASTVENIVEQQHQQRIESHYANQPLAYGSGDMVGSSIADAAGKELTLSDRPLAP